MNAIGESACLITQVGVRWPYWTQDGDLKPQLEIEATMAISEDTEILKVRVNRPVGEETRGERSLRSLEGDERDGATIEWFDKVIGQLESRSVSRTMLLCQWAMDKSLDLKIREVLRAIALLTGRLCPF